MAYILKAAKIDILVAVIHDHVMNNVLVSRCYDGIVFDHVEIVLQRWDRKHLTEIVRALGF